MSNDAGIAMPQITHIVFKGVGMAGRNKGRDCDIKHGVKHT